MKVYVCLGIGGAYHVICECDGMAWTDTTHRTLADAKNRMEWLLSSDQGCGGLCTGFFLAPFYTVGYN